MTDPDVFDLVLKGVGGTASVLTLGTWLKSVVDKARADDAAGNIRRTLRKAWDRVDPRKMKQGALLPGAFMKWFDHVRYVDDDQLQDLWADLLAGALEGRHDDHRIGWAMNQLAKLAPQDAIVLSAARAGRTLWIETDREPNHPGWRLRDSLWFLSDESLFWVTDLSVKDATSAIKRRLSAEPDSWETRRGSTTILCVHISHYSAGVTSQVHIELYGMKDNITSFTDTIGVRALSDYGEYEPFLQSDTTIMARLSGLMEEITLGKLVNQP